MVLIEVVQATTFSSPRSMAPANSPAGSAMARPPGSRRPARGGAPPASPRPYPSVRGMPMGCFRIFPATVPTLRIGSSRRLVSLAVGILLAVFAYRDLLLFEPKRAIPDPVERLMFEAADTSPDLIVYIAHWMLLRGLDRWRPLPAQGVPLRLTTPLLAAGAGILVWARLTGAHDLMAVSLLAFGLGLASLWKGVAGVRLMLLPAGFLVFALPLPPAFANAVIFRFQLWTAQLTGWLLYLFALPARVVGESILRSDFTFSVVEGCSGLRSVVTL